MRILIIINFSKGLTLLSHSLPLSFLYGNHPLYFSRHTLISSNSNLTFKIIFYFRVLFIFIPFCYLILDITFSFYETCQKASRHMFYSLLLHKFLTWIDKQLGAFSISSSPPRPSSFARGTTTILNINHTSLGR